MENNTPKDCPFFEPDEKDQTIFYCTLTEDYINRFFALCVTTNYNQCEYYREEENRKNETEK